MLGDKDVTAVLAQKDLAAARKFYEEVLGLKVIKEAADGGVAMQSGAGSIFLYVTPQNAGTNQATAAAWNVDDVAAIANDLKAKGVTMEHYDIPGATLEGDVHVMGSMKAIWFKDPGGNILNVVSGM